MKDLSKYIFEQFDTYRITDLIVRYNVSNEDNSDKISFYLPAAYSESDFQIYLQDKYLNDLPADVKYADKFFGKNADNIYDVLFEYDKYEKDNKEPENYIDWDSSKSSNDHNPDKEEFGYVTLTNLKYVIKFDEFDFEDENDYNIKDTLIKIFKPTESSSDNKYPITLTLDEKNIDYKE